jgi:hypothetical protein
LGWTSPATGHRGTDRKGTGCSLVAVMKAPHLGDRDDAALRGRLDVSGEGGVLFQGEAKPGFIIIIVDVIPENPAQMLPSEYDNVVQALPPN